MALRAVVIGAGWAGEGHTKALRLAGVEVAALCGRTPEPARAMARKLGVEEVRFDWRQALAELQPDIAAIATPASAHHEIALYAAALGCHVACEKPLGLDADQARAMLRAVEQAGVKHSYCTTSRYAPAAVHARTLLASGLIGQVQEIEALHHFCTSPLLPYSWFHQLDRGGGALNNDFTHFLGQVLFITGGAVQAVSGEARRLIKSAPVGPPIHDLRVGLIPLTPSEVEGAEWQDVDADMGYTVMSRLVMPEGHIASALFQGSEMGSGRCPNGLAFYGSKGSLHLSGAFFSETIEHFDRDRRIWEEIPITDEVCAGLAWTEDPAQSAWDQLYREFVADIRGEGYAGYPTFRDGWVANAVMDSVRNGQGWTVVAEEPEEPRQATHIPQASTE